MAGGAEEGRVTGVLFIWAWPFGARSIIEAARVQKAFQ